MILNSSRIRAIEKSLSPTRLHRYVVASHYNKRSAIILDQWNAQISAAFMLALHITEVIIRNAITEAIEAVYGPNWFAAGGAFERSLPIVKSRAYDARRDLAKIRSKHKTAGKIIPELKFMFWVTMLTSRHDARLGVPHIRRAFINLPPTWSPATARQLLHDQLDEVRIFRNRIAHHEPIFMRNLEADFKRLSKFINWRSSEVKDWLASMSSVNDLLAKRP